MPEITIEEMVDLFSGAEYEKEYGRFTEIKCTHVTRPDLHAFILLNSLVPSRSDLVSCAAHDQIWLDVDVEKLALVITRAQVIELIRCSIRYDETTESLYMFV